MPEAPDVHGRTSGAMPEATAPCALHSGRSLRFQEVPLHIHVPRKSADSGLALAPAQQIHLTSDRLLECAFGLVTTWLASILICVAL